MSTTKVLFSERVAAEEVFPQVGDCVVQGFAGIAWLETELASGFGAVEIPEVLGHFDGARFNG